MEKTTVGEKIGYGIASLGDAVGFGLVGTFLMFFLTNVASVPPAIARYCYNNRHSVECIVQSCNRVLCG